MMTIGGLARSTRESVKTLRYWSDRGLLDVERSASGYRIFPAAAVDRVAFIRSAQALGFSLGEIRGIVDLRSEGATPCRDVRAGLARHLASVRERIATLRALEEELDRREAWASGDVDPQCPRDCVYLASEPPLRRGLRRKPSP
jgi:DNA-binding transcriptional MerR regulator